MKPTMVSSNTNTSNTSNGGVNIPINREYSTGSGGGPQGSAQTHHYASPPGSYTRLNNQEPPQQHQQQQQPPPTPSQQSSQQFSDFGFDSDIDMDMFPRSRLSRMHHDPFSTFGSNAPQFNFPQFNSLGRRRANDVVDDDDEFFRRMPQEFRQYIPEKFGQRRTPGSSGVGGPTPVSGVGSYYQNIPPTPSRVVCDAAIQTEDPSGSTGRDQVDHAAPRFQSTPPYEQQQQKQMPPFNSKRTSPPGTQQQHQQPQHYGQYTGQTASPIQKGYYAPQQQQQSIYSRQQTPPPSSAPQTPGGSYIRTIPIHVEGRNEPLINNRDIPAQSSAAYSSTSTPVPSSANVHAYTSPKYQAQQQHQQQQSQPHRPPPLNTQQQPQQHQENQYEQQHQEPIPLPEPPTLSSNQQQQQQQQQPNEAGVAGVAPPPQTPHTMDSIQRIQDIQRDVLALMSHVEKFTGRREDKEYVYLDEMLTRNLLKLDNIDTNGKESIRLARKEAIRCIQASINVLEAKAEENRKRIQQHQSLQLTHQEPQEQQPQQTQHSMSNASLHNSNSGGGMGQTVNESASGEITTTTATTVATTTITIPTTPPTPTTVIKTEPISTTKITPTSKESKLKKIKNSFPEQQASGEIIQAPIPLPPPDNMTVPTSTPNSKNNNKTTIEADEKNVKCNENYDGQTEKKEENDENSIKSNDYSEKESSPLKDITSNNSEQVEAAASSVSASSNVANINNSK